jgi:hypothetical protein
MHEKMVGGGGSVVNGFEIRMMVKSSAIEIVIKSWGLFRIYLLIDTANPTLFD